MQGFARPRQQRHHDHPIYRGPGAHGVGSGSVRARGQPEPGGARTIFRDRGRTQGGADQLGVRRRHHLGRAVADDEALEITRQTQATREESLRLTRLRFENGVTSELDFRLAESLVETARAALAQLSRQRATDLNSLALLLGQPVPAEFQTSASTDRSSSRTCRRACPPKCSSPGRTCGWPNSN